MEMQFVLAGAEPQKRSLNDLDFVPAQFADIPKRSQVDRRLRFCDACGVLVGTKNGETK